MVGLERSVLPLVGKQDFGLRSSTAILAFVLAFGAAKAITNLAAGGLAERVGPQTAAGDRLAGRAAGAAPDRPRALAGASSSPRTSCWASTRAWPGR